MGKKTGSAGRFGSKYGKKIRDKIKEIDAKKKKKYKCPSCSRIAVVREASGIWICKKCGAKYASGAYEFKSK
ncbi:MAG: 50S ribosomal protein L37ae [Candidatus Aenigmarchaeota archaeon]|nr:50S ribosomal protein L37ae [Candidatus Aenigmarchaeota archaeon]